MQDQRAEYMIDDGSPSRLSFKNGRLKASHGSQLMANNISEREQINSYGAKRPMPRSASAAAGSLVKAARLPQVPSNEQLKDRDLLNELEISIIDKYETPGAAAPVKGLNKNPSSILKNNTAAHRAAASLNVSSSTRKILSRYSAPVYKGSKEPHH